MHLKFEFLRQNSKLKCMQKFWTINCTLRLAAPLHKNQSLQRVNLRKYTNSLFICKDKNEDMFDNQAKISVKFNVKGHRTFAIAYSKAESKPQYDTDLPEILTTFDW